MVQKNLIIILVVLWIMPQSMAKRTMNSKFIKAQRVQYKQEDEMINDHHSCTSIECDYFQTDRDGEIDLTSKRET